MRLRHNRLTPFYCSYHCPIFNSALCITPRYGIIWSLSWPSQEDFSMPCEVFDQLSLSHLRLCTKQLNRASAPCPDGDAGSQRRVPDLFCFFQCNQSGNSALARSLVNSSTQWVVECG